MVFRALRFKISVHICDRRYYVDEYSPASYFDLNKYVEIPVYVKVFQKRNGDLAYSFCVQQKLAPVLKGAGFARYKQNRIFASLASR